MVGRLVCRLVGCSVDWSVGLYIGRVVSRLVGWSVDWSVVL